MSSGCRSNCEGSLGNRRYLCSDLLECDAERLRSADVQVRQHLAIGPRAVQRFLRRNGDFDEEFGEERLAETIHASKAETWADMVLEIVKSVAEFTQSAAG